MNVQEYRKMTKEQLKGRKVRTNVPLSTRVMEIPVGTILTIAGKSNGLELESEACAHCGVKVYIRKVEPYMVDLLPVQRTALEVMDTSTICTGSDAETVEPRGIVQR